MDQIANELHRKSNKVKTYRKILSNKVNQIWSLDLVEMNNFNNENN